MWDSERKTFAETCQVFIRAAVDHSPRVDAGLRTQAFRGRVPARVDMSGFSPKPTNKNLLVDRN